MSMLMLFLRRTDRYGPTWTGQDITDNLSATKDYLGITISIAISTVGNSLMSLVSAKAAGAAARCVHRAAFVSHLPTFTEFCNPRGFPWGDLEW